MAGRFSFLSSVTSPPDLVCGVCSLLAAARPLPPPPPPRPTSKLQCSPRCRCGSKDARRPRRFEAATRSIVR